MGSSTEDPPPECKSIHEAVAKQDKRAVAWFLQRHPECVVLQDEDQRTPLLLAAAAGDNSTCTLLIRRMAAYDERAINLPDAAGLTPLHWALTLQHADTAALLLRSGAGTSAADEDGRRPLHTAAFSGNVQCVSQLLPHVPCESVDARSADGLVPLHYAALSGSAAVVTLLLDARASLHALDDEGRSALSWAAAEGHAAAVAALLEARADASAADRNGMAPLHHAAKEGSLPCVQLLLQAGASALQRSVGGSLPEDIARSLPAGGTAAQLVAVLKAAGEAEALARQEQLLAELDGEGSPGGGAAGKARRKKLRAKEKRRAAALAKEAGPLDYAVAQAESEADDSSGSDADADAAALDPCVGAVKDRARRPCAAPAEKAPPPRLSPRAADAELAALQPAWQTPRGPPPAARLKGPTEARAALFGGAVAELDKLKSKPSLRSQPALPPLQLAPPRDGAPPQVSTPGRTPKPPLAAHGARSPSGAATARCSREERFRPPLASHASLQAVQPQPPAAPAGRPAAGGRRRVAQEEPPAAAAAAAAAARGALATPQSVSSWVAQATVEQRRALAQFITQLTPGAAVADRALASARAYSKAEAEGEAAGAPAGAGHSPVGVEGESRVGRVRMLDEAILGRGRSGTSVLLGYFEGKRAAIKVVSKARAAHGHAAAECALMASREAELLDLCENENAHPNVLRLFGCEETSSHLYLALELCVASMHDLVVATREPATLGSRRRALLGRLGLSPPPLQQATLPHALRRLLEQLLDGLCHLHRLDILHCKLRPSSVLINSNGVVKLSGLGLGRVASVGLRADSRQSVRNAIAADGFDPAEVLHSAMGGDQEVLSAAAKKAADVFSCGVLIFWILTGGRHPFGEEPAQRRSNILQGEPVALSQLRRLPEAQHLVSLMLLLDPNARLQAEQARQHPALWSDEQKLLLVRCVSDEPELTDDKSKLVQALEEQSRNVFGAEGWGTRLHAELLAVLVSHRSYQQNSIRDLMRGIRNCDHLQGMPPEVQRLLLPRPTGIAAYFLPRFPSLFWTLYCLVEDHWKRRRVFDPFFSWQSADAGRRPSPSTVTPPAIESFRL